MSEREARLIQWRHNKFIEREKEREDSKNKRRERGTSENVFFFFNNKIIWQMRMKVQDASCETRRQVTREGERKR